MCWHKENPKKHVMALEILRRYVTEAEPLINKQLRLNNADANEVALFDSLFSNSDIPKYMYRWLPSYYVTIIDDILTDNAYLSCSSNPGSFINHVSDKDLACYMINTCEELKTINVNALLPNHNNEGEYILPRGIKLEVTADKLYKQSEFSHFLREIHCNDVRDTEMVDIYPIESIRLIKTEIHLD